MIIHATVLHVSPGWRYADRLDVTLLLHRPGQADLQVDDAYLWANTTLGQLQGSLLLAAVKSGETVRVTGEDKELFGFQITGVEMPMRVNA